MWARRAQDDSRHHEDTRMPEFPLHPPDLPSLGYTLHTRKGSIAIFWTLVLIDVVVLPIVLYFALYYGTHLSHNAVFSISTGALGTVSGFEYFRRFWRLWRKGSDCRVIGGRRLYLDWFHWNYSFAWLIIMVELIVGTIPREPPIRLLAMPVSTMLFAFSVEMIAFDVLRLLSIPSPVRISSLSAGSALRPGIYSIIEDVVAVDGSGGTVYRQNLNARYEASHLFRQMLHRLTLFWSGGALLCAAGTTAVVFTVPKPVAYTIGWTVPWIWAGVWIIVTVIWVKVDLKDEKTKWQGPESWQLKVAE